MTISDSSPAPDRRFLALATALFALGLVFGSFVNPLFRVPDERFHVDMVEVAGEVPELLEQGWPLMGERHLGTAVTAVSRSHKPIGYAHTTANDIPRDQRTSLGELATTGRVGTVNRMAAHPPLYYIVLAGGGALGEVIDPGGMAFDMYLWLLRVVNILLLVPLPVLAYLTATRLTVHPEVHRAAALLPLAVPGFSLRNAPIVNNDNLVTLFGAVVAYLAVRVVDGDTARGTAVAGGIACGLAMVTKAFGLALLAAFGVAYAIALVRQLRSRRSVRPAIGSSILAAVAATASGGWWYIRNLVVLGEVREQGFPRPALNGFVPDWSEWIPRILVDSWTSFWGGTFALGPRVDRGLLFFLIVLMVVSVIGAVASPRLPSVRVLAALLPLAILALIVYTNQAMAYAERGRIAFQGRYLYGGLVGLLSVMATGLGVLFGRVRRWLPLTVVVLAGAVYTVAYYRFLIREWGTRSDDLVDRVYAMLAWAAPAPWLVVGVGTAFALVGLLAAWTCVPWRPEKRPGGHPHDDAFQQSTIHGA